MKLKDSYADPASGESYVLVSYKGNTFNGKAKLHPDDEWSNFTGCRYAEMRAEIKALKDEWKKKKAACEECRKFVVAVSQYANFDKSSPSAKAMFRQLNRRIKEVNEIAEQIGLLQMRLNIAISQQNKVKQNRLNKNT